MTLAGTADLGALERKQQRALVALLSRTTARASGRGEISIDVDDQLIGLLPHAARIHRVSGTVERGLDGVDGVPEGVGGALASAREASALRHLVTIGALEQIRRSFEAADVSWVVMKGPVVASLLYPGVGERSYNDIDLLVDGSDFPAAMHALEQLGYRHDIHNWVLAERMLAGAVGMASPLAHADLHWHLHYSRDDRRQFDIRPREMIGRARTVEVSGIAVPTFDAVDTLITLGFHAARSGGHRLIWLKDIERSLAVDRPDLDELVRRCRSYRCAAPVGLMMERARVVLGAEVPREIVQAMVPEVLLRADRAVDRLWPWIRLHEGDTVARWLSRSARESVPVTLGAIPARAWRTAGRRLRPPPVNESDDEREKASFLAAVVAACEGS